MIAAKLLRTADAVSVLAAAPHSDFTVDSYKKIHAPEIAVI